MLYLKGESLHSKENAYGNVTIYSPYAIKVTDESLVSFFILRSGRNKMTSQNSSIFFSDALTKTSYF
jgi:hypothetical protein